MPGPPQRPGAGHPHPWTDPGFDLWRERAIDRGYSANFAYPLRVGSKGSAYDPAVADARLKLFREERS